MYKAFLTASVLCFSLAGYAVSEKEMIKVCKEECKADMKGKGSKAAHKCADMKKEDGTAKYPKCQAAHEAHEKSDGHEHGKDDHGH